MKDLGSPAGPSFDLSPGFHAFGAGIGLTIFRAMLLIVPAALLLERSPATPERVLLVIGAEIIAACILFPGIPAYLWRLGGRAKVEPCERGVRARLSGGRTVELPYAEISAVSATFLSRIHNGSLWGESLRMGLYREGEQKPALVLDGDFKGKLGDDHPFIALYFACFAKVRERIEAALREGRSVKGKGWELSRDALTAAGGSIPLADIAAIDQDDGKIRVWAKGKDDAFARIDAGAPNALVMYRILTDRVAGRGAETADGAGLGRILLVRRWLGVDGAILAGVTLLLGLLLPVSIGNPGGSLPGKIFMGALLLALGFALYRVLMRRFWIHERGARIRGLAGETSLRDEEVSELRFAATRHYVNGAYQGTIYDILLVGSPEAGKRRIRYRATLNLLEDQLDAFRNRIASRIAGRIVQSVAGGGQAPWCNHDVLAPAGLRVRPKKLIGYAEEISVPYADVGEAQFKEGVCYLYRRSKPDESITYIEQNDHGFWPGYFALAELTARAQSSSTPAQG